jgi:hypothetical protein
VPGYDFQRCRLFRISSAQTTTGMITVQIAIVGQCSELSCDDFCRKYLSERNGAGNIIMMIMDVPRQHHPEQDRPCG